MALQDVLVTGGDSLLERDHLIGIMKSRAEGETIYWSSFMPFLSDGTKLAGISHQGTVTGVSLATSLTFSDEICMKKMWPGCLILEDGTTDLYVVKKVTSKTTVDIYGAVVAPGFAASFFTLYQTHSFLRSIYPPHIEQFANLLIYTVTDPMNTKDDTQVGPRAFGPLRSIVSETILTWASATKTISSNIISAFASNRGSPATMVAMGGGVSSDEYAYNLDSTASNWTVATFPNSAYQPGNYPDYVRYLGGYFWAFGGTPGNGVLWRSNDGVTWAATQEIDISDESLRFQDIAYGNGLYVAIDIGNNLSCIGTTGENWITYELDNPVGNDTNRVIWSGEKFIAVGENGLVGFSEDGRVWQQTTPPLATDDMNDVVAGPEYCIAVGDSGVMWKGKLAGTDWERLEKATGKHIYRIVYEGGTYYACGATGLIMSSGDNFSVRGKGELLSKFRSYDPYGSPRWMGNWQDRRTAKARFNKVSCLFRIFNLYPAISLFSPQNSGSPDPVIVPCGKTKGSKWMSP